MSENRQCQSEINAQKPEKLRETAVMSKRTMWAAVSAQHIESLAPGSPTEM